MSNPAPPAKSVPDKIRFDYIKGNFFRTARADGAWAGTNGYSDLVISFFSERTPIPQQTVHPLTDQHTLGDEILAERRVRDTIIRELEICLSMNLDVAKSLMSLLKRQIDVLEAGTSGSKSQESKGVAE